MYFYYKILCVLLLLSPGCLFLNTTTVHPMKPAVVLWHGMGDSCCFEFSLGRVKSMIEKAIPGVYVLSVKIGNSIVEDIENGYFLEANEQVQRVCDMISKDPYLQNGYNAIGFSQGAQFLRALVQRCTGTPMINLISLGGQHQGVYGIPNCASLDHYACNYVRKLLNYIAYEGWVQHTLVQASYWHDPLNEDKYKTHSVFLADINNEMSINQNYIDNLQKLNKLVLVRFENDTIVQPVETEWFGFYRPGQDKETLAYHELPVNFNLGLNTMNELGKIDFLSTKGNHLQFTEDWFNEFIIGPYLSQ